MRLGGIGHCDIIVKTSTAKAAPAHNDSYQHDWDFINYITENGNYKKANDVNATYHVMRLPGYRLVDTID